MLKNKYSLLATLLICEFLFTTGIAFADTVPSTAQIINEVNKARVSYSMLPLVENGKLDSAALAKARSIASLGSLVHSSAPSDQEWPTLLKVGYIYDSAGENLALAPTLEIAHQGLMNSQGHRENILSPDFHKIGIGVIDGGIYGKMFVQEFTN